MKNKREKKHIGKYLYFDWLLPIEDYFSIIKLKEAVFDIVLPIVISIVAVVIYSNNLLVQSAIEKLNEILPNILAILIGFSISAIAIITSNNDNKMYAKEIEGKYLGEHVVTVYRYLLIIMIVTIVQEVLTLIFVFLVCFFRALCQNFIIDNIILGIYVFLILNILAILVRAVVYVYVSNFLR